MTVSILVLLLYMLTGQVWTPVMQPRMAARAPQAQWCYYGSIQATLRCPPGHGVQHGSR